MLSTYVFKSKAMCVSHISYFQCDPGYGVKAFVEMMCNETTFIMIIGPACSSVSEVTADAANLVNLVQVMQPVYHY